MKALAQTEEVFIRPKDKLLNKKRKTETETEKVFPYHFIHSP